MLTRPLPLFARPCSVQPFLCSFSPQFPVFIGLYRAIIGFGTDAVANEGFLWLPSLQVRIGRGWRELKYGTLCT